MDDRQRILNDLIDEGVRHWRYWRPHGKESRGERQIRLQKANEFLSNFDSKEQVESLTCAETQVVLLGIMVRTPDRRPVRRRVQFKLKGVFWMTVISWGYLALSTFLIVLFLSSLGFLLRILSWWWNSVKTIGGLL